jgi:hypothetical protein
MTNRAVFLSILSMDSYHRNGEGLQRLRRSVQTEGMGIMARALQNLAP